MSKAKLSDNGRAAGLRKGKQDIEAVFIRFKDNYRLVEIKWDDCKTSGSYHHSFLTVVKTKEEKK